MRRHTTILLLLALCVGCDHFAAKRRQAVQAKRQAVIKNLRELGEAMHAEPQQEPPAETVAPNESDHPRHPP